MNFEQLLQYQGALLYCRRLRQWMVFAYIVVLAFGMIAWKVEWITIAQLFIGTMIASLLLIIKQDKDLSMQDTTLDWVFETEIESYDDEPTMDESSR